MPHPRRPPAGFHQAAICIIERAELSRKLRRNESISKTFHKSERLVPATGKQRTIVTQSPIPRNQGETAVLYNCRHRTKAWPKEDPAGFVLGEQATETK